MNEKIYSTAQAAKFVGLSLGVFKYHLYEVDPPHLTADIQLGKEIGFYESTLEAFKAKHQSKNYTIQEAADYLGVDYHRIRHHVMVTKVLAPDGKRGKAFTFSQAVLEGAKARIVAPLPGGRPKKPK